MCSKKFFIRFLPFFATLLVGMFVASFFVTIGRPAWAGRRGRHFEEDRQFRCEMERLREENLRLKNQLNDLRMNAQSDFSEFEVPPPPPPPPVITLKPAAPRAIR